MAQTVTALYDTYDSAVPAVDALEAAGIPHSDISIVSNNVDGRYSKDQPTHVGADAGKGAGIGAAVGGVGGLLTGLGLLAIPGIGPVVAAGWLVATAAGAVTGAVVGGTAGGLVGSLTHAGVPCDEAARWSPPASMTHVHRQLEKSFNAISRWIPLVVARHTGKAAGAPSTQTRQPILPSKLRRSADAISAAVFSYRVRRDADSVSGCVTTLRVTEDTANENNIFTCPRPINGRGLYHDASPGGRLPEGRRSGGSRWTFCRPSRRSRGRRGLRHWSS
jgi:hypothetical protein